MNITEIQNSLITHRYKGIPGGTPPFRLADIGQQGWNVLRQDLPLPLAIMKQSALKHNSRWMQAFLRATGVDLAPHGKTSMSPQLFKQQFDDGAWAMTAATVSQIQVYRDFGCPRIIMANQLLGKQNIRYILDELHRDEAFDFYCLVDSIEGVELLKKAVVRHPVTRPLQVLIEIGYLGGRTGCRDRQSALQVAHAVKEAYPHLALCGIEGFEGMIGAPTLAERDARVTAFLDEMAQVAQACDNASLFASDEIILTAGGSSFYDVVVQQFTQYTFSQPMRIVIRSGCYLTHDIKLYHHAFEEIQQRSAVVQALGKGLQPAIEVWSYVQSRPEPTRAYLTMGRRDCSSDAGMPQPQLWYSPAHHQQPMPLPTGYTITRVNDQHAYLSVPADSPLQVGDMIGCGISHPCTTFDKWQLMPIVNDTYDVVSAIRTYF